MQYELQFAIAIERGDKCGRRFRGEFKAMAFDNGAEFLNFEEIEKSNMDGAVKMR